MSWVSSLQSLPTSVLFHGPNAQEDALYAAQEYGRILGIYGESGLKVSQARELVSLLLSPPISDRMGSIVCRIDGSTPQAADALLKQLEEPRAEAIPFLWAMDLGDVIGTIRSRCLLRWSPGFVGAVNKDDVMVKEAIQGSLVAIRFLLNGAKNRDSQRELLDALLYQLLQNHPGADFDCVLWSKLRCVLGRESRCQIGHALLSGVQ